MNDVIPRGEFGKWLEDKNAIWVKHLDFDELMLLVLSECELEQPQKERFDKLIQAYRDRFRDLHDRVFAQPASKEQKILEAAAQAAASRFKDWWSVELEAQQLARTDPAAAEHVYKNGIEQFPSESGLLNNYALFLENVRKDYDQAEQLYKRAIGAEPKDADILGNYAGFLLALGRPEEAWPMLEQTYTLSPSDALRLECLFYEYAHRQEARQRARALNKLRNLLVAGMRSPGWNLDNNVARAESDGHHNIPLLRILAKVIIDETPLRDLSQFKEWEAAKGGD